MEKIQKNLTLAYKTRNGIKVLNKAKLRLDKKLMDILQVNEEEKNCVFLYENNIISLKKGIMEEEIDLRNKNNIIKIIKNISIIWEKSRADYTIPFVSIPLGVVNQLGINKEDKSIDIFPKKNELIIKKGENMLSELEKEKKLEINPSFLEKISENEYLKRNGSVITVKVGKGGIGKTFITTQLAVGIAEYGLKVLVITSDPQNDVMGMCYPKEKEPEYKGGLKHWVTKGEGDIVKLRPNVDFIPLEDAKFGNSFRSKFPNFINLMRCKYDYILIDSMPMMAIDELYHKESDKVIIPLFGDKFTIRGAVKVMEEIGLEKILAVIFNRFDNTTEQKLNFEEVQNYIEGSGVLMPKPIKRLSYIQNMTASGKTIWDNKKIVKNEDGSEEVIYNNKQLDETRESFTEIIEDMISKTYTEPDIMKI